MTLKKLPLGIQNFKKIIEGDYVYIDKTQFIYNLINGASYNFLSRPRRFGKSLLIDTIAEVFSGDNGLFAGLWIYDSNYDFIKHPVVRLDMSSISTENPKSLKASIASRLKKRIQDEGLNISDEIPSDLFICLIEGLYKKYNRQVVVLIDEYDKPILDHIGDFEIAEANRQVIRGFYGILKSMDPYLRFTLMTGVSKFTKTSVFSELNNFLDITLSKKFANICGATIDDLNVYFRDHIKYLSALDEFLHYNNLYGEIIAWYDGYSWDGKTTVINPFSLLSFLEQQKFGSFWYASGTPAFLIDLLKKKPESFITLKNLKITERTLDNPDVRNMEIEPLLFQTGYLTVKDVLLTNGPPVYLLDIPNFEVRDALNMQIISTFTASGDILAERSQMDIAEALGAGDLRKMLVILRKLFASIPYNLHIDREAYYHSIFYAVMSVLGFKMDVEVSVSKGRVDAVLELADIVYVMEFKYKDCPPDASPKVKSILFEDALNEAMAQINDRGYSKKYIGSGKKIFHAAFAFLGRDNIEMRTESLGKME